MTHRQHETLNALIKQIHGNDTAYPNKTADWRALHRWLNNGNLTMALHVANEMMSAMENLAAGRPADLQGLLDQIHSNVTAYPKKTADLAALQRWLDNGNFTMAAYQAETMLLAMDNVCANVPARLQILVDKIRHIATTYPNKAPDCAALQRWMDNGNFTMALFQANEILTAMTNVTAGIPADLQDLLDLIRNNPVSYPKKHADCASLQRWLDNGNFKMACHLAHEMITAMENVQGAVPAELLTLLEQIHANPTSYPQKSADWGAVQRWMNNGDFTLALFQANAMITAMKNLA